MHGSKTPFVVFAHGMLDPYFKRAYPLKHLKKQIYWSLFLGKTMNAAARVVFTAEEESELARGAFKGYSHYKRTVIGYGTADPPMALASQVSAFYGQCPGAEGRELVLFLSRIHPKKGCDILIKAFAAVAPEFPDVDLVIAGPDTAGWQSELVSLAFSLGVSQRIHWPGMLSGDAKWGAFRVSKAFILPSHQENFGVAVAEALACSLPVLITQKVNIWREIVGSGAGLASSDDENSTRNQLRHFLRLGGQAREKMARSARQLFLDRFDVNKTALSVKDLITSIAKQ